jgi:hypothetical protein
MDACWTKAIVDEQGRKQADGSKLESFHFLVSGQGSQRALDTAVAIKEHTRRWDLFSMCTSAAEVGWLCSTCIEARRNEDFPSKYVCQTRTWSYRVMYILMLVLSSQLIIMLAQALIQRKTTRWSNFIRSSALKRPVGSLFHCTPTRRGYTGHVTLARRLREEREVRVAHISTESRMPRILTSPFSLYDSLVFVFHKSLVLNLSKATSIWHCQQDALNEFRCGRDDWAVYLLLVPSTALYLLWVCGGLDGLVRQSLTLYIVF